MPVAVLKCVREVSSEDSIHLASNLLKENAGKKWKTQAVGEKSAHVILEFEEPQQINGIDIGNEHAAFVEVLVSKSGCQPDDFKEILLSSSFMTPIESKNSSNVNRVRCFSGDALSSSTLPDKWKLVKIVCTQPFNKHVQYGLSFIKLHIAAAVKHKPLVPDKFKLAPRLGQFKLREESPDSEPDCKASSSLFQRWKASRNEPAVSTAAAIRDAASPAALRRLSDTRSASLKVQTCPATASASASLSAEKTESKPLDRNRDALLFGDDDPESDELEASSADARKQRLSKHIEADKSRRRLELEKELEKKKAKAKRQSIDNPKESPKPAAVAPKESPKPVSMRPQKRLSSSIDDVSSPAKKPKTKPEKPIQYVPFNQLLKGVVLVISGIQNPDRGDLRSKAVALGAKYKADWEAGCTHLICAFRNTPKYNQVKGKGKIVTRSWIEKCYALKKYLPWRRYALDTTELGQLESDEELCDLSLKPTVDDDVKAVQLVEKNKAQQEHSSDPDTEDELERVVQKNKLKKNSDENQNDIKNNKVDISSQKKVSKSQDVYEVSTDEEDYMQEMQKKKLSIKNIQ